MSTLPDLVVRCFCACFGALDSCLVALYLHHYFIFLIQLLIVFDFVLPYMIGSDFFSWNLDLVFVDLHAPSNRSNVFDLTGFSLIGSTPYLSAVLPR